MLLRKKIKQLENIVEYKLPEESYMLEVLYLTVNLQGQAESYIGETINTKTNESIIHPKPAWAAAAEIESEKRLEQFKKRIAEIDNSEDTQEEKQGESIIKGLNKPSQDTGDVSKNDVEIFTDGQGHYSTSKFIKESEDYPEHYKNVLPFQKMVKHW